MHQHQGVARSGGDQGRGDHGLAEGRGRRQYAGIVQEQGVGGRLLLTGELAGEVRFDRAADVAFVTPADGDSQRGEQILRRIAAAARQRHVVRRQFGAADDARDAERGQAHRLMAVELGILKRGQTNEPVYHGGRQPGSSDIHLIAQHYLHGLRQRVVDRNVRLLPGRPGQPRRFVLVLHHRQAYAEHAPTPPGFFGQVTHLGGGHAPDRRQVPPLVGMGLKAVVQEYAVARLARTVLQRQGDEIAEPAGRHGVLTGKQPVVGLEPDVRVVFHRLGEQPGAKSARRRRGNRIGEEDPHVDSPAGPRPLQRGRNSVGLTGGKKDGRVPAPRVLVEVDGQEPAGLVAQQRIDAHGEVLAVRVPAAEMSADDFISHRYEGAVRTLPALDPRLVADARRPFVGTRGCVTRPAAARVGPSPREYVVAAAEERSEQRDLLGRR